MPSEEEIRSLVRSVVEGALKPSPPAAAAGAATTERSEPAAGDGQVRVALGADHGGYRLKELLAGFLRERGYRVVDCGTSGTEAVDYPDFAQAVAERVGGGDCGWGIVVDGAGIGSCMVANKIPGVRAALCYDLSSARNSREHNHANVLTLGAGLIGDGLARQIVETWLNTPWGGDRHARRVEMISAVEARYLRPREK